ncbi:hypothetical protein AB0E83_34045, partial [Streptomyces sp. NPDC035033]
MRPLVREGRAEGRGGLAGGRRPPGRVAARPAHRDVLGHGDAVPGRPPGDVAGGSGRAGTGRAPARPDARD